MNTSSKIVLVTFGLFMTEAIMHYNMGKNENSNESTRKGFLPPTKSLIKIGGIVFVFSLLNSIIIEEI